MEEKIFNEDFFRKLSNINLNINLKLSQGAQGGRKSKAKGMSVEFSDCREYAPGDDFRRVDWNAYGRLDKLFIKVFMEEREGIFNIFLDKSRSMDYGKINKKNTALQIGAALSYIALNNLDRVYFNLLEDDKISMLQGGSGKKGFQSILKQLEYVKFEGSTNMGSAITKKKMGTRGVSIVISDFFDNKGIESIEKALKYLSYKKQQIILVQVLSNEEINPSIENEVTLVDSESNEKIKLSLNSKIISSYKNALKDFNEQLEALALKYGGTFISVESGKSLEKIILKDLGRKGVIS